MGNEEGRKERGKGKVGGVKEGRERGGEVREECR